MKLTNNQTSALLRSENPLEAKALFAATRKDYCARASGLMQNNDEAVSIQPEEADDFTHGVLRDDDLPKHFKWQVCKLMLALFNSRLNAGIQASDRTSLSQQLPITSRLIGCCVTRATLLQ